MKVFIVDDSLIVCARLITLLTEIQGVEIVGQARTPDDAVTSILRNNPDVVIMDIQMPGGTGIDVLMKIRAEKCLATVIIFTNYPYPQYRKRCEEAGANYFFDKSNEFESIVGVVEQLRESKQLTAAKASEKKLMVMWMKRKPSTGSVSCTGFDIFGG